VPRTYKIPGGNWGIWIVAGVAFLAVLFALIVGFVPPAQLKVGTPVLYVSLVAGGMIIFVGLSFIINAYKKPSWLKHPDIESE